MAADVRLTAQPRAEIGKGPARRMRAAGRVPAVVYGRGEDTRKVSVDAHDLMRLLTTVHVENTIIELDIEGEVSVKALVREIQSHAFRDDVLHIDFYQIHAGERVSVAIPLHFIGAAPGVKAGGMLQHVLDELEIRCLPDSIPEHLEVDISTLEIGDSVHVGQIVLPEGVELEIDAERTVCSVLPPTVVKEEAAAAEPETASAEPEVIRRAREEEEG